MNKIKIFSVTVFSLFIISACSDWEDEQEIDLKDVPQHILNAANEAVPGIQITEAELEKAKVYELEGSLNDAEYEIKISEDGVVLEIEMEKEEGQSDK